MLLRALLGLAIAGQVSLAIWLWPELPERIPTHFGAGGEPDGWGQRDYEWFVISGLLAILGIVTGYALPWLARRLARSNSTWLNVSDQKRFRELPEAARVRAIAATGHWLVVIAIELQLLMAFLLIGTFLIASKTWQRLPPVALYGGLAVLLGTAIALAIDSSRAVKRELAKR